MVLAAKNAKLAKNMYNFATFAFFAANRNIRALFNCDFPLSVRHG